MQNLVDGVHFFQDVGFKQYEQLFSRLANGQKPEACFITCSDSRIDPNLITHADPGQIFIVRNVGNIVPCHGTSNNGEMAAIEFAIECLGIEDVIICGHTHCGAMRGLLEPYTLDSLPHVQDWLRHAESTASIVREHYAHLAGDDLLNVAAQENVLMQIEHLRTLPIIAARLPRKKVRLHGWMYKIETGEIFAYDVHARQFTKLSRSGSVADPDRDCDSADGSPLACDASFI